MKGGISFAEIRAIAKFLSVYEGGYIEKNYVGGNGIAFKFRKSGINSTYLHVMGNEFLFLGEENLIDGKKNLIPVENMPIDSVEQVGTDRILEIRGGKDILIEMMAGGNIFVVSNGIIEYSKRHAKRKNVAMEKGSKYIYPDFIDFENESFPLVEKIKESSGDPVRTLASRIGLSKYAEEVICGLGGSITTNEQLLGRSDDIKKLLREILEGAEEGKVFLYDDSYFVWKSRCRSEEPEVLDLLDGLKKIYELSIETGTGKDESIRRSVEKMTEEMERFRRFGEIVMANLDEVNNLVISSNKHQNDEAIIDYEKGLVYYKKDEMEIPIKLNMTAGENAANFFDSSKKIKEKLSRVTFGKERPVERSQKKTVHRIYTNYRWFINSDGNLVIAGKDAESNDSVVKKYMDENDLYFHADIHGAPSVIMKVRAPPSQQGIEEAAIFAWSMSKAWNAGFGNGAVYYVTKSQVSKSPESGEYLARGAWIIRGKKNYVTHLELKIAVGFQIYENREYVVSAPVSCIKGSRVIVIPGEGKEEVIKEISEFLGVEKEAIYPVLPPGKWDIEGKFSA